MANLQDILKLAKADGGKFFVMDEKGDVKLVIMGIDDYQSVLLNKLQKQVQDIESVNREITKAQLTEKEILVPDIVSSVLPKNLPAQSGNGQTNHKFEDLREEVIDPSFDFEGPKINLEDI
jgi:hypothetical protein